MSKHLLLSEELSSKAGYLIRPYIQMNGQKNGYYWANSKRGFWRTFISMNKVNFTFKETGKILFRTIYIFLMPFDSLIGRKNKHNLEKYIADAFYRGSYKTFDNPRDCNAIGKYFYFKLPLHTVLSLSQNIVNLFLSFSNGNNY